MRLYLGVKEVPTVEKALRVARQFTFFTGAELTTIENVIERMEGLKYEPGNVKITLTMEVVDNEQC